MKLGVFGGTFDPVHLGHLILAEWCREECGLDEVWFVPAPSPPHKDRSEITPAPLRAEMLELAVAGCPKFGVSRIEFDREGPSYTVETLQQLQAEGADRELFLLVGGDSLRDFSTWREPQRIAELATVVAVNRGRESLLSSDQMQQTLGAATAARIREVRMPAIDISATELRQRVREGRSIRFLTPRAVEAFIDEQRLYRSAAE